MQPSPLDLQSCTLGNRPRSPVLSHLREVILGTFSTSANRHCSCSRMLSRSEDLVFVCFVGKRKSLTFVHCKRGGSVTNIQFRQQTLSVSCSLYVRESGRQTVGGGFCNLLINADMSYIFLGICPLAVGCHERRNEGPLC